MPPFVKRRKPAPPGSVPAVLGMFHAEVRFYQEIAPVAGVRVPSCYRARDDGSGTLLELEDLSAWSPGADPAAAARILGGMHRRWAGQAPERWPWLRPPGAGASLVEQLFAGTWLELARRGDIPPEAAAFGARMAEPGQVTAAERAIAGAGPLTLVHGDAQARNMRTSPDGEIALLDWEDVSAAPGILDLAWLLTASTAPASETRRSPPTARSATSTASSQPSWSRDCSCCRTRCPARQRHAPSQPASPKPCDDSSNHQRMAFAIEKRGTDLSSYGS